MFCLLRGFRQKDIKTFLPAAVFLTEGHKAMFCLLRGFLTEGPFRQKDRKTYYICCCLRPIHTPLPWGGAGGGL